MSEEKRKGPSFVLLWFPAIIFGMLAALVAWLWLSYVDIVTPVIGTLQPVEKIKVIDATAPSIIKTIEVRNGDQVAKGQVLISFEDVDAAASAQQSRDGLAISERKLWRLYALEALMTSDQDAEILLSFLLEAKGDDRLDQEALTLQRQWRAHKAQLRKAYEEIISLEQSRGRSKADIARLEASLPFYQETLDRNSRLFELRALSFQALEDSRQKLIDSKEAIVVEIERFKEAEASLEIKQRDLDVILREFERDISLEISDSEGDIESLQQDLIKSEQALSQQAVRTPIAGTITELVENTLGGVVSTGDILMKIVPLNRKLEMEAKVPTTDIGFVKVGQSVRVKIDTFQFTKYGYINGTVRQISANAIKDEETGAFVYTTLVEMASNQMKVDGSVVDLVPGMTGSVDIQTGQRRLADYIISPFLRYRDEAMRER